jgi:hypothetical protein
MTLRHARPDDELTTYVRERWVDLVSDAAVLCADPRDAEPVVIEAMARLEARIRPRHPTDDVGDLLMRQLVRACVDHDKGRGGGEPAGIQMMEVVSDQPASESGSGELVRRALAALPSRQRAVIVLRYRGLATAAVDADPGDGLALTSFDVGRRAAELLGCSPVIVKLELTKALDRLEDVLGLDAIGAVKGDGSSRTEAMLRRALGDAPAVPVTPASLLALARRLSRLRRRRALAVPAAAAVVVLAVVLSTLHGSSPVVAPTTTAVTAIVPAPPVALSRLASANPSGVVSGDGFMWTVELHPSARHGGTTIERRDLTTGRPLQSYQVPGEDFGIGYGLGKIWAWGADDGRPLVNEVSTLDPASGRVTTVGMGTGSIQSVAFTSRGAWFTQPQRNRIVVLTAGLRTGRAVFRADGAGDIGTLTTDSVASLDSGGAVLELPLGVVINHNDISLTLLSTTPSHGVWIGHVDDLSYQPTINSPLTVSLRLPLQAAHVVGDPATGVYVATESSNPQYVSPYLLYYSPQALRAPHPRAVARLDGDVEVQSMTAGVNGGLVFVATDGSVVEWNPSRQVRIEAAG